MLRVRLGDDLFGFGVDAENIRRLTSGQPIKIDLGAMAGPPVEIFIFYGPTMADLVKLVEEGTGLALPVLSGEQIGNVDDDHGSNPLMGTSH